MQNLNTVRAEGEILAKIGIRAAKMLRCPGFKLDPIAIGSEVATVHAMSCPLDLAAFLRAPDPVFFAEITTIRKNLDRATGKFNNNFEPKFKQQRTP